MNKKLVGWLIALAFIVPVPVAYIALQATIWPTPTTVTCSDENYDDKPISSGDYCIRKPGNVRESYDELLSAKQFDAAIYRGIVSVVIAVGIGVGCIKILDMIDKRYNDRRRTTND